MINKYININALLNRIVDHQQHVERFVGFIGVVDRAFQVPMNIARPLPPSDWQSTVLLTAQQNLSENGLYQIDERGLWQSLPTDLEPGNIVALGSQNPESNRYFKLIEINLQKQIWQPFELSGLNPLQVQ
ncbi:hypothetical protein [Pseudoalteromonas luteoviolacea]|uniref:Uncharacterized protein n=1 Tax=Pseudoalteromonas luteoviolacea (strain 2ta16) TaxID=1353533 RepID=V4JDU9_PSEL2|nr:hypothetical protein [Pseudoalteromonas luteoviolacea]ESP93242.1 hypothetical protein PL2TA16_03463 [Pseudoalteromonas luteoviolacea 2ta16]KZN36639.1 hypothetical protein N483_22225 [Pseudoalteromonas luteoviolacea NCIMB 1944]